MTATPAPFPCASLIREIGRGARGARSLSRQDAHDLYQAVLAGRVSDVELGAVLLSYRIKGESADELAGMLQAVHESLSPVGPPQGGPAVSIPSYNGARRQPNLVPLLALLLARSGVQVLVHGVTADPGRVTSAEILAELGIAAADGAAAAEASLAAHGVAFMPTATLSPALARQLSLRAVLGVRNSAHTLAKLLQPFRRPALRLVNYTHPPYRDTLAELFLQPDAAGPAGVLLARGTEGEAVADAAVPRRIEWLRGGQACVVVEAQPRGERGDPALPPSREAAPTAEWIREALAGRAPVPQAILDQVRAIRHALEQSG